MEFKKQTSPSKWYVDKANNALRSKVDGITQILNKEGVALGGSSAEIAEINQKFTDQEEPAGFPIDSTTGEIDRSGCTLSWSNATRTLTLTRTGTDYDVYVEGNRVNITTDLTATITDTEGSWFFYIDNTGTLNATQTFNINFIYSQSFVAYLYWDATNKVSIFDDSALDERHGAKMDGHTHAWLHQNNGTRFQSGIALNSILADQNGSLDTHAQFGVDTGVIYDEDIRFETPAIASTTGLRYFYQDASGNWRSATNAGFSMPTAGTGRLAYNQTGVGLTEATNNDFVLCHIFATSGSDINGKVYAIVGQNEYPILADAQAGAQTEINNLILAGLPSQEFRFVGTVIFQTSTTYANAVKAKLVSDSDGNDYVDFRFADITASGASVASHPNLASLDWTSSGHTGTANYLAGFGAGGEAANIQHGVIDEALTQSLGDTTFNSTNGDYDLTINKNTAGIAYVYDAGLDKHTFNSDIDVVGGRLYMNAGTETDGVINIEVPESNAKGLVFDTDLSNRFAGIVMQNAGTDAWGIEKDTSNNFNLYDYTNSLNVLNLDSTAKKATLNDATSNTARYDVEIGAYNGGYIQQAFFPGSGATPILFNNDLTIGGVNNDLIINNGTINSFEHDSSAETTTFKSDAQYKVGAISIDNVNGTVGDRFSSLAWYDNGILTFDWYYHNGAFELYENKTGFVALSIDETQGDLTFNSNATFNNGALDSDFTINKQTAGVAYSYDAGTDKHNFGSNVGIGVADADEALEIDGVIHLSEEATPTAPAALDGGKIYVKSDGKPYFISNALAETDLTATGAGGGASINVETLAANKTLVGGTDAKYQNLDPNGAARTISLDTVGSSSGDEFVITNSGDDTQYLIIENGVGGSDFTRLYRGASAGYAFDGTNWQPVSENSGSLDTTTQGITVYGALANASALRSTAIGYGAVADEDDCVSIGHSSDCGRPFNVAIGRIAKATAFDSTAVGYNASCTSNSDCCAFGYNSEAQGASSSSFGHSSSCSVGGSSSVAFGASASCSATSSNAIGRSAISDANYSQAYGASSDTNGKQRAFVKGAYTQAENTGDEVVNISGSNLKSNIAKYVDNGYYEITTDATQTELELHNVAGQRYVLLANSSVIFKYSVIARDDTGNDAAAWTITGCIKRDGANNTALVGTVTKDQIAADAGASTWDVDVEADDTNEALVIKVTGEVATTIRWAAKLETTEVKF